MIYAYGCSYTSFMIPTWADILHKETGIVRNISFAGIGNVGIASNILRTNLVVGFKPKDIICILWSHWFRQDLFKGEEWKCKGGIPNDLYDLKYVKKYWSYENDIIKNGTAIISTETMFKENIKFSGHILCPGKPEHVLGKSDNNVLLDSYIKKMSTKNILAKDYYPKWDEYTFDGHPSLLCHLNYTIDVIAPSLGITLSNDTIDYFLEIDEEFRKKDFVDDAIANKIFEKRKFEYAPMLSIWNYNEH